MTACDVAVVGAGSSGAAVAGMLAAHGLRVVVLERRPLDDAGASWMNGIPRAAFRDAGIALPGPGEGEGPVPFHLLADRQRTLVTEHDMLEVDMRRLVARLQATAAAAGATFVPGVIVHGRDDDTLRTSAGGFRARWIVDASGLTGARLIDQPEIARERVCAAAQEIREVTDRAAAAAWFTDQGIPAGQVCARVGVAGGYSVLNVRLLHDGAAVGILTGAIPALGFPSGIAILHDFVRTHPWIGRRLSGGAGPIPLGRAHHRLADDRVALLGDAGCQVFPAHGSGVGAGLVAARLLADVIAAGAPLRDYEVAWQRRHGGTFAAFEAVRRWNQSVGARDLGQLMGLGLIDVDLLRAGIDQMLPRPSLGRLPRQARALLGTGHARGVVSAVARSAALRAVYAGYPRRAAGVARWARVVDWLLAA